MERLNDLTQITQVITKYLCFLLQHWGGFMPLCVGPGQGCNASRCTGLVPLWMFTPWGGGSQIDLAVHERWLLSKSSKTCVLPNSVVTVQSYSTGPSVISPSFLEHCLQMEGNLVCPSLWQSMYQETPQAWANWEGWSLYLWDTFSYSYDAVPQGSVLKHLCFSICIHAQIIVSIPMALYPFFFF